MVGPLRFYPPYTNGLVVHATFFFYLFFSLIIAWNRFWQIFFSNFLAKKGKYGKYCFRTSELVKVWTKMTYFIKFSLCSFPVNFSIIKKSGFLLSGRGGYPSPYTLSGPTTKKITFFYLCIPLGATFKKSSSFSGALR